MMRAAHSLIRRSKYLLLSIRNPFSGFGISQRSLFACPEAVHTCHIGYKITAKGSRPFALEGLIPLRRCFFKKGDKTSNGGHNADGGKSAQENVSKKPSGAAENRDACPSGKHPEKDPPKSFDERDTEQASANQHAQLTDSQHVPDGKTTLEKSAAEQEDSSAEGCPAHQTEQAKGPESDMERKFKEDLQQLAGQSKIERHVREDPTWLPVQLWDELIANPLRGAWSSLVLVTCCNGLNKEKHRADLLEGCVDAYWMVLKLWSEQEWELLQTMVSDRLLNVFRATSDDYAANNLLLRTEPEGEVRPVLRDVQLLNTQGRLRYSDQPGPAAEPGSETQAAVFDNGAGGFEGYWSLGQRTFSGLYPYNTRWHLVFTVTFYGSLKSMEVNSGGQVVREILDKKPQRWRFCSTDTVLLLDSRAAKIVGQRFAKIRADDFQQWTVLDIA